MNIYKHFLSILPVEQHLKCISYFNRYATQHTYYSYSTTIWNSFFFLFKFYFSPNFISGLFLFFFFSKRKRERELKRVHGEEIINISDVKYLYIYAFLFYILFLSIFLLRNLFFGLSTCIIMYTFVYVFVSFCLFVYFFSVYSSYYSALSLLGMNYLMLCIMHIYMFIHSGVLWFSYK